MNHLSGRSERRAKDRRQSQRRADAVRRARDPRWGNSAELVGFRIAAADRTIGKVADFCIEEESLVITELVVVARRLLVGRKRIFVPLDAIERIDWPNRKVYLRSTWREVRRWSESSVSPC